MVNTGNGADCTLQSSPPPSVFPELSSFPYSLILFLTFEQSRIDSNGDEASMSNLHLFESIDSFVVCRKKDRGVMDLRKIRATDTYSEREVADA